MPDGQIALERLWTLTRLLYAGFSIASIVTGLSYLPLVHGPAELPDALLLITGIIPVWVYGILWLVAGVAGLIAAIMDLRPPWLAIGTSLQFGMAFVWASSYTVAWLQEWDRSYVSSSSYWARALPILAVGILARAYRSEIRDER